MSASASHSEPRRGAAAVALKMWRGAVALVVCAALSGCAGGPAFSQLFDDSAAGEGTGFQGAALVRAVVILARHQATPQQRSVAERNAGQAIARMERQIAAERPQTAARKKSTARKTAGPTAAPAKKLPARIVVKTVKDEKTAPGAEAAVMIYDVQARRIVGNEVYDIEDEPRPNETVKFDTNVVRYVGAATY